MSNLFQNFEFICLEQNFSFVEEGDVNSKKN